MIAVSVVALFCEDIRDEVSGAHTLVGVISDHIRVPAIPGALAKLSIYVRINFDPEYDPGEISVRLRMSDGTEMPLTKFEPELIAKAKSDALASGFPVAGLISKTAAAPFPITQRGITRVLVNVGGAEFLGGALECDVAAPTSPSTG
jgi:hypothetical protein